MTATEHDVHAAHPHDHGPECGHASTVHDGHYDEH